MRELLKEVKDVSTMVSPALVGVDGVEGRSLRARETFVVIAQRRGGKV